MEFIELWDKKAKLEKEVEDLHHEVEHIRSVIGRVIDILIELKDSSTVH